MVKKIDSMDGVELAEILKEAETYEPTKQSPTSRQREDFHNLLRFALDITGAPPRGYEDDEQSTMERTGSEYERRKRQSKRKLVDIVRAINDMVDKYPDLKVRYKEDLDKLP